MKKKTPFKTAHLPLSGLNYLNLISGISKTNRILGRYDSILQTLPNPEIMVSSLLNREAEQSSRIEGTQSSFEEIVLANDDDPSLEKNADLSEAINYRKAIKYLLGKDEPLSLNSIKKTHQILLQGVRGENKRRGEFRIDQNRIGPRGCKMYEADYIPPSPLDMPLALDNWEKYWHQNDRDPIIQSAIIHAQFELIHPFMDGNGRIGRLLIPLFLWNKGIISSGPNFFISEILEKNEDKYKGYLQRISDKNDWEGWIEFYLDMVSLQATNNIERINKANKLYSTLLQIVKDNTQSQSYLEIVEFIFIKPVFRAKDMIEHIKGVSPVSVYKYIKLLVNLGIISKSGNNSRNQIHIFKDLLKIIHS